MKTYLRIYDDRVLLLVKYNAYYKQYDIEVTLVYDLAAESLDHVTVSIHRDSDGRYMAMFIDGDKVTCHSWWKEEDPVVMPITAIGWWEQAVHHFLGMECCILVPYARLTHLRDTMLEKAQSRAEEALCIWANGYYYDVMLKL